MMKHIYLTMVVLCALQIIQETRGCYSLCPLILRKARNTRGRAGPEGSIVEDAIHNSTYHGTAVEEIQSTPNKEDENEDRESQQDSLPDILAEIGSLDGGLSSNASIDNPVLQHSSESVNSNDPLIINKELCLTPSSNLYKLINVTAGDIISYDNSSESSDIGKSIPPNDEENGLNFTYKSKLEYDNFSNGLKTGENLQNTKNKKVEEDLLHEFDTQNKDIDELEIEKSSVKENEHNQKAISRKEKDIIDRLTKKDFTDISKDNEDDLKTSTEFIESKRNTHEMVEEVNDVTNKEVQTFLTNDLDENVQSIQEQELANEDEIIKNEELLKNDKTGAEAEILMPFNQDIQLIVEKETKNEVISPTEASHIDMKLAKTESKAEGITNKSNENVSINIEKDNAHSSIDSEAIENKINPTEVEEVVEKNTNQRVEEDLSVEDFEIVSDSFKSEYQNDKNRKYDLTDIKEVSEEDLLKISDSSVSDKHMESLNTDENVESLVNVSNEHNNTIKGSKNEETQSSGNDIESISNKSVSETISYESTEQVLKDINKENEAHFENINAESNNNVVEDNLKHLSLQDQGLTKEDAASTEASPLKLEAVVMNEDNLRANESIEKGLQNRDLKNDRMTEQSNYLTNEEIQMSLTNIQNTNIQLTDGQDFASTDKPIDNEELSGNEKVDEVAGKARKESEEDDQKVHLNNESSNIKSIAEQQNKRDQTSKETCHFDMAVVQNEQSSEMIDVNHEEDTTQDADKNFTESVHLEEGSTVEIKEDKLMSLSNEPNENIPPIDEQKSIKNHKSNEIVKTFGEATNAKYSENNSISEEIEYNNLKSMSIHQNQKIKSVVKQEQEEILSTRANISDVQKKFEVAMDKSNEKDFTPNTVDKNDSSKVSSKIIEKLQLKDNKTDQKIEKVHNDIEDEIYNYSSNDSNANITFTDEIYVRPLIESSEIELNNDNDIPEAISMENEIILENEYEDTLTHRLKDEKYYSDILSNEMVINKTTKEIINNFNKNDVKSPEEQEPSTQDTSSIEASNLEVVQKESESEVLMDNHSRKDTTDIVIDYDKNLKVTNHIVKAVDNQTDGDTVEPISIDGCQEVKDVQDREDASSIDESSIYPEDIENESQSIFLTKMTKSNDTSSITPRQIEQSLTEVKEKMKKTLSHGEENDQIYSTNEQNFDIQTNRGQELDVERDQDVDTITENERHISLPRNLNINIQSIIDHMLSKEGEYNDNEKLLEKDEAREMNEKNDDAWKDGKSLSLLNEASKKIQSTEVHESPKEGESNENEKLLEKDEAGKMIEKNHDDTEGGKKSKKNRSIEIQEPAKEGESIENKEFLEKDKTYEVNVSSMNIEATDNNRDLEENKSNDYVDFFSFIEEEHLFLTDDNQREQQNFSELVTEEELKNPDENQILGNFSKEEFSINLTTTIFKIINDSNDESLKSTTSDSPLSHENVEDSSQAQFLSVSQEFVVNNTASSSNIRKRSQWHKREPSYSTMDAQYMSFKHDLTEPIDDEDDLSNEKSVFTGESNEAGTSDDEEAFDFDSGENVENILPGILQSQFQNEMYDNDISNRRMSVLYDISEESSSTFERSKIEEKLSSDISLTNSTSTKSTEGNVHQSASFESKIEEEEVQIQIETLLIDDLKEVEHFPQESKSEQHQYNVSNTELPGSDINNDDASINEFDSIFDYDDNQDDENEQLDESREEANYLQSPLEFLTTRDNTPETSTLLLEVETGDIKSSDEEQGTDLTKSLDNRRCSLNENITNALEEAFKATEEIFVCNESIEVPANCSNIEPTEPHALKLTDPSSKINLTSHVIQDTSTEFKAE